MRLYVIHGMCNTRAILKLTLKYKTHSTFFSFFFFYCGDRCAFGSIVVPINPKGDRGRTNHLLLLVLFFVLLCLGGL